MTDLAVLVVLPVDPASADTPARAGLALCRSAGVDYWTAAALNLLAESALHTGNLTEAAAWATEALTVARQAGDVWPEGYALGTAAAVAAAGGRLRDAQQLATDALAVMTGLAVLAALWLCGWAVWAISVN